MGRPSRYSLEVPERAVRMVLVLEREHDSQWVAIRSGAEKIGCATEPLRQWVQTVDRDTGSRPGLTADERWQLEALERENRELKRANEILCKASSLFAQGGTRPPTEAMVTFIDAHPARVNGHSNFPTCWSAPLEVDGLG